MVLKSGMSTYSVSENIGLTPLFTLKSDPVCVESGATGFPLGALNSEKNGVTGIPIAEDDIVTCTFENQKDGLLDIVKNTIRRHHDIINGVYVIPCTC